MSDSLISKGDNEMLDIFTCLAEQMKSPWVQVSALNDALDPNSQMSIYETTKNISEISTTATQLIDGFLLSVRSSNQSELKLEPVAIGSLLYDVANIVLRYARVVGCEVRLEVNKNCGLVMANANILKSALTNLAYSFVNANESSDSKPIRIVADYSNGKVMTGVFSNTANLSKELLSRAQKIKGIAHQPMQKFSSDNSAGVFVADSLFNNLGMSLDLVRYGGGIGLASRLLPSSQLSLM